LTNDLTVVVVFFLFFVLPIALSIYSSEMGLCITPIHLFISKSTKGFHPLLTTLLEKTY